MLIAGAILLVIAAGIARGTAIGGGVPAVAGVVLPVAGALA